MIQESPECIQIIFPEQLTENHVKDIHKKLIKSTLYPDVLNKKELPELKINLSLIEDLDFFGYQYLYSFYHYLKNNLKIKILLLKNKYFKNFEKKMGLNLNI